MSPNRTNEFIESLQFISNSTEDPELSAPIDQAIEKLEEVKDARLEAAIERFEAEDW